MTRTISRTAIAALASIGLAIPLVLPLAPALATGYPTGQATLGQSTVEVGYNDANGQLTYLLTPDKAKFHPAPTSWAPIYVVVYPTSVASYITTPLNCMHLGGDNCPDHGPGVSAGAAAIMPSVYGGGVLGHDHLLDVPGGSEFNVAWVPILILFTSTAAAQTHITTEAQLDAALNAHDAIEVPIPAAAFYCTVVPQRVFDLATPVTPV